MKLSHQARSKLDSFTWCAPNIFSGAISEREFLCAALLKMGSNRMNRAVRAAMALAGLFAVAGCGSSNSCHGLVATGTFNAGGQLVEQLTNTDDAPKLVTVTLKDPQGHTIATEGPIRVVAKDVVTQPITGGMTWSQENALAQLGAQTDADLKAKGWSVDVACQ
jgi:hypothetical protein